MIAHFDWLPIPGNVVDATEQLILRYTPTWPFAGRAGLYPQWLIDLQSAGFTGDRDVLLRPRRALLARGMGRARARKRAGLRNAGSTSA